MYRFAFPARSLGAVLVWLMALAAASGVSAQQPSPELQELRDTANAFYRAGDYVQSLRFAEQALPLFIREFGPEHEQTGVHYYSLGLIAEAAGNLQLARKYYADTVRVREKIYGVDGPSVAEGLEKLGKVYLKLGQPDAAEPHLRRALKLKQGLIGFRHVYFASAHSSLGDLALARRDWAAALASYREAISLLAGQDTSQAIVKSIADEEIRRQRDTFTGLCRAMWETRQQSDRAAAFEETFLAGQQAWNTSAASALAKMTARLGAGNTDLGRRIRNVQDLSERVLRLNADDQKLLGEWYKVQMADPAYSGALEEFKAASIANFRNPAVKRQRELAQQFQALIQRCPPGQKKAGCDDREREALAKELGEVSQAAGAGAGAIMAVSRRMQAAEKALPGYAEFTARRTALRNEIDRADTAVRNARAEIVRAFPELRRALRPETPEGRRGQGPARARRGARCHPGRLGEELRVGADARARRVGRDRCRRADFG